VRQVQIYEELERMSLRTGNVRIAVLHSPESSVTARDILRSSSGLANIVFVVSSDAGRSWIDIISRIADVRQVGSEEWLATVTDLRPAGVVTFTDELVVLADEVIRALGLRGAARPDTWDKLYQRRHLVESGNCSIKFESVNNATELVAARSNIPGAAILKPRYSHGGYGIHLVDANARDEELRVLPVEWDGYRNRGYVLEERFRDDESFSSSWRAPYVSVDSVSIGKVHRPVALLGKFRQYNTYIETGDFAPVTMSADIESQILDTVIASLTSLGIADRVTHTEVRLTAVGPQVIEVNGRIGGDVHATWNWLTGQDLVRLALELACGRAVDVASGVRATSKQVANIRIPVQSVDEDMLRRARRLASSAPHFWKLDSPPRLTPKLGVWFRSESGHLTPSIRKFMECLLVDEQLKGWCDDQWVTSMVAKLALGNAEALHMPANFPGRAV
jgi:hypothetical protein